MAQVLLATTSFKEESFVDVLNIYEKLGWKDIDVNLHPFLFHSERESEFLAQLKKFNVGFASGGWCDFFHVGEMWKKSEESVEKQVQACKKMGAKSLRLFFGRLHKEDYDQKQLENVVSNISYFGKKHPDLRFSFENHDGASLDPKIVLEMIQHVDLPNVGMTLDPINYFKVSSDPHEAIDLHGPKIFHVHVKGMTADKHYCEYGEGAFDYKSFLRHLKQVGYKGSFTVEYEGENNPVMRLFKSYNQFKKDLADLGL